MAKYSIGYNNDPKFLELLDIFKGCISEVYFPPPNSLFASGRVISQGKKHSDSIKKILKACKKHGITSNLIINSTCEGDGMGEKKHDDKIIRYIQNLKGLTSVTVANPVQILRLKKAAPKILIHSSVNCYVKTIEHAEYLKELGVDVLTIDRDINRNISLIKDIKKRTGLKIKMLLNEGCLLDCPFRHAHFNMISHGKDTDYFDENSCPVIYKKHPEKALSIPFVRPEDVKHYKGVVDYFKLATRSMPSLKIPIVLNSYIQEKYEGDLLFLFSTRGLFKYIEKIDNNVLNKNGFFEKLWGCSRDCTKCDYCNDLMKKAAVVRG